VTIDEARLWAHEHAMQHDPHYRAVMDRITAERERNEAAFAAWCAQRKAGQQARRAARALRMLRLRVVAPLPMARVWMRGPKWKRAFDVQHRLLADVAPLSAPYHRQGKKIWVYDFVDDVRELVCEPLQYDRLAMWSDPWERFGIERRRA
jgi:hypothetical protein